jgi:hypothetical protein
MQQETDMRNGMADYIETVLTARGIPYDSRPRINGCVVFSFDDRMVAKSVVTEIFEDAFAMETGGYVEARVKH